jgi:hypothetical protein
MLTVKRAESCMFPGKLEQAIWTSFRISSKFNYCFPTQVSRENVIAYLNAWNRRGRKRRNTTIVNMEENRWQQVGFKRWVYN